MKAVNLFLLSREVPEEVREDYECALSERTKSIRYRPEEIDIIRSVIKSFIQHKVPLSLYDGWFYSFTIPQVGKEFDLLRIHESSVLNLELKSQAVDETKIEKQLIQNRYYLGHLKKEIYSFTLVKDDSGVLNLYRYEDGLRASSFDELLCILGNEDLFITENIEEVFDPCVYLVSPINTPDRFLRGEYFLNSQQNYIKREIITKGNGLFGIKGSAGTGKTLLLYDIAAELGKTKKTCVVHSAVLSDGHHYLADNEDAFSVISAKTINTDTFSSYEAICVDETQRLSTDDLDRVLEAFNCGTAEICVFSYDYQQSLSVGEIERNNPKRLNGLEGFREYALTNKIRTNDEISSFIRTMLHLYDRPRKEIPYDCIDVVYANNNEELATILRLYSSKGYQYIRLTPSETVEDQMQEYPSSADSRLVIGQEFDKVVVVMDSMFSYDANGELTAKMQTEPDYLFQRLFYQNITRVRKKLCIVVLNNPELIECLLGIKNYSMDFKRTAERKPVRD